MTGVRRMIDGLCLLVVAGSAGAGAAATQKPVGSLCNANGKIEVMATVTGIECVDAPDQELKALLKARAEFQDKSGLSAEQRAMIDARIQRRIREIWKIQSAAKEEAAKSRTAAAN